MGLVRNRNVRKTFSRPEFPACSLSDTPKLALIVSHVTSKVYRQQRQMCGCATWKWPAAKSIHSQTVTTVTRLGAFRCAEKQQQQQQQNIALTKITTEMLYRNNCAENGRKKYHECVFKIRYNCRRYGLPMLFRKLTAVSRKNRLKRKILMF